MQKRIADGEKPEVVSMDDYDIPPAPLRYTILRWRERLGASYNEAMATPFEAILQDLEMLDYEAEYGPTRA